MPHHLLDLRQPWQAYSAAEFARDARAAIEDIVARGRLPVLAGGTGLYFQALLRGLSPMPAADPATRAVLARGRRARLGGHASGLPRSIGPPRERPAIRSASSAEAYRLSGRPISDWQRRRAAPRPPVRVLKLVIAPADRATA